MTEVRFYHLQHQSIDGVLPGLLERSLERGWRVVVQTASDERVEALDAYLWTYGADSFLPHGTSRQSEAAAQPILLTAGEGNPNAAHVRFLLDGTDLPEDASAYERIVLLFDGNDDDAVAAARARWTQARERGLEASYWQPDERGRWMKKA